MNNLETEIMETANQKAIIYDDNCPMCSLYTQGFVRWGLLEPQNRIPFSQAESADILSQLNSDKARHEIPLVDLAGGPTRYGPDALLYLLSQKIPYLINLVKIPAVQVAINGLYHFISYNRRVIIPANNTVSGFNCAPDFNRKYRLRFIYIAVLIAGLLTYAFGASLENTLPIGNGSFKMLLIAGSGWVVQIILALVFLKQKQLEYMGQLAVIMLLGVFVLVPGILLSTIWASPVVPLVSVIFSSGLMVHQHIFRILHLQLSQSWTWLWFISLQSTAAAWVYYFFL